MLPIDQVAVKGDAEGTPKAHPPSLMSLERALRSMLPVDHPRPKVYNGLLGKCAHLYGWTPGEEGHAGPSSSWSRGRHDAPPVDVWSFAV